MKSSETKSSPTRKSRAKQTRDQSRQYTPLFTISLPDLAFGGEIANRKVALLSNELLAVLAEAKVPPEACVLFVSSVEGELPSERLKRQDRLTLKKSIEALLAQSLPSSVLVGLSSVILFLNLAYESATDSGLPSLEREQPPLRAVKEVSGRIVEAFNEIAKGKLADLPRGFASRKKELIALHDAVRSIIAEAFEDTINEHIKSLPQGNYEEKKALAKWINAELRRVGLAIKCPKTNQPCSIVATTGNQPSIGRFVLDYTDERGKRHHPVSWASLPTLELMLDDLTRAPYGQRQSQSR